ncbi:sensor domain-containing diguanylate cyclase [Fervidobacterium gondwanense]|uniref:sensor domain-containing diguanylate cyclase n=2 Tax=Fervidobacterium gondwanense TaxID=44754 RepID=UPI003A70D7F9
MKNSSVNTLPFTFDFEVVAKALSRSKIFVIVFDEFGRIVRCTDNTPVKLKGKEILLDAFENFGEIIKKTIEKGFCEEILECKRTKEKIRAIVFKGQAYLWMIGEVITEKLLVDEIISERLETLSTYLEFAPVFFVVLDENGIISYINNWTLEKTGYKFAEVIGKNWFEIFIPADIRKTLLEVFADIMDGKVELRQTYENEILAKDGSTITVLWENKLLTKGGKPYGTISVGVDVTDQKVKDFEEQVLLEILDASSDANYHASISKISRILSKTCNARKVIGTIRTPEEAKNIELLNMDNTDRTEYYKFEKSTDEKTITLEMHCGTLPSYATYNCLQNVANVLINFLDRIYYIQKLEEASFRDPLTNLFNRRYFIMMLQSEIRRIKRYGGNASIVMIDLDGLKQINDTLGHDMGDLAIKTLARAMLENTRNSDICARFGGDEFAILLPNTTIQNAQLTIQRLMNYLDNLDIKEFKVSMSAGITKILPEDDTEGISVLKRADELLYKAKKSGKHAIVADIV